MLTKTDDPLAEMYALCLEHAVVDSAFSPRLTRQWFDAAFATCADFIGLVYPAQHIDEMLTVDQEYGCIYLSYRATSPVVLYDGITIVGTFAPNTPCLYGEGSCGILCCHCAVRAIYTVGEDLPCGKLPPMFAQAVMHLFAMIAENRGDSQVGDQMLTDSGAKQFLAPHITYVM